MHTKALWPGRGSPLPALIVATGEADILRPHLQASGWAQFGRPRPLDPTGQLVIAHHRLWLLVDGTTIADGINPVSPPGWWRAVDHSDGLCVVVVIADGDVDFTALTAGQHGSSPADHRTSPLRRPTRPQLNNARPCGPGQP